MRVKNIIDEDFVNYKKPSMFIATCFCDWKCCTELGIDISICQNSLTAQQKTIDISTDEILRRYINNPITQAVVIGGLEPMLQFDEVSELIHTFRENGCNDTFVIYTGYQLDEIHFEYKYLQTHFKGIVLKIGRYIPNHKPHYDEVLGISLASDNQKGIILC